MGSEMCIRDRHNATVPPVLDKEVLKVHAMNANAWVWLLSSDEWAKVGRKNGHRNLPDNLPIGLYTHLTGLVVTIGGMPVDLGLPASFDHQTATKANVLDL